MHDKYCMTCTIFISVSYVPLYTDKETLSLRNYNMIIFYRSFQKLISLVCMPIPRAYKLLPASFYIGPGHIHFVEVLQGSIHLDIQIILI